MPQRISTEELRDLIDGGDAQIVEVLPRAAYDQEHLPGAVNVPLVDMDAASVAAASLDRSRPTVTYCYDHECDLSARAAWRLEQLGFADVYDYTASKTAWLGAGHEAEGTIRAEDRAGAIARAVPTVLPSATISEALEVAGTEPTIAVVNDQGVLLGAVHLVASAATGELAVGEIMQPGPPSVRPSITGRELAASMDDDRRSHVFVTLLDGTLIGMIERRVLHGEH